MSFATVAPVVAGLAAAGLSGSRNSEKYRGLADSQKGQLRRMYFSGWNSGDAVKMLEAKNSLDVLRANSAQMSSRDTMNVGLGAAGATAALIALKNRGKNPYSLSTVAPLAAGLAAYSMSGVPLAKHHATNSNINEVRRIRDERAGRSKFNKMFLRTLPSDNELRVTNKVQTNAAENAKHLVNRDKIGIGLAAAGLTAGGVALAKRLRRRRDEKQGRLRERAEGNDHGLPGAQPRFTR